MKSMETILDSLHYLPLVLFLALVCGWAASSTQSDGTDQTQKEILNQLKQINWAIRIGIFYIMLVISGIIKLPIL